MVPLRVSNNKFTYKWWYILKVHNGDFKRVGTLWGFVKGTKMMSFDPCCSLVAKNNLILNKWMFKKHQLNIIKWGPNSSWTCFTKLSCCSRWGTTHIHPSTQTCKRGLSSHLNHFALCTIWLCSLGVNPIKTSLACKYAMTSASS
jgi:hypothetical protein